MRTNAVQMGRTADVRLARTNRCARTTNLNSFGRFAAHRPSPLGASRLRPARRALSISHPDPIGREGPTQSRLDIKQDPDGLVPSFGFSTARPLLLFLLLAIRDRSQTIDFYFPLVAQCPTPPSLLSSVDRA